MRISFFTAIFLFVFCFFQLSLFSQPFSLLKDINYGNPGQCLGKPRHPMNLIEVNGLLYFSIHSISPSYGLWKSDGTEAGTVRIKDIAGIETIININGLLFFYTGEFGTGYLWRSDGTEAGTQLIKTLSNIKNLTNVNGILFFSDDAGLWKSDGTEAGTLLVKPFTSILHNLTNVNGTLFFSTVLYPPSRGTLWKSDGTEAGTVLLKEGYSGSGVFAFSNFFNANGVLYFVADDGINGDELWKSDGTDAGTVMIKDIDPGTDGSNVRNYTIANGVTYFFATTTALNTVALWKTDGTDAGTIMVKEIHGGSLTNVNGVLYFAGSDGIDDHELWKTDGTEAGTVRVKDIFPGLSGSYTNNITNVNGTIFFSAINETVPPGGPITCTFSWGELWKSDGTDAGTVMVKDIYKGAGVSNPNRLVNVNGILFFVANNGTDGPELWKSNGSAAGTVMVKNLTYPTGNSNPRYFTSSNGQVYFSAFDQHATPGGIRGEELFKTDGIISGTYQVGEIFSIGSGFPSQLTDLNGLLLFSASNGSHGFELWKADGTQSGTVMVKDINPYLGSTGDRSGNPLHLTYVNRFLFFSATDGTNGYELWKTDGTNAGTVMVKDINPGAGDSNPANLLNVNGVLYFTADNGTDGIELWKSDGTEAGTVIVKNINTGSNSSSPVYLTAINAVLYFAANDGINGIELWKSDGTATGTVLVKNINASGNSSSPAFLTNVNGTLYFAAEDGVNGVEVWKSNGTGAGTVLVKDIYAGPAGSNPNLFTNFNGITLFAADDGIAGRELWGSIGTSTGTILIKDIQPGPTGSNPSVLRKVGNNVLFAADDGIHGTEVWLTNSSEQGTRMMSEIQTGIEGSDPTEIFEYGAKVLVAATESLVGKEVWIADVPADIVILPEAKIIVTGPLAICNGNNILLKANTGTGYTYQWKKSGTNINGATQSNYTTALSGAYAVVVTDAFGRSTTSEQVVITSATPPLASIAAAGPLTFCAGKNVLLKATTGTGYTYQWKKAGVNIDNTILSSYTAIEPGSYSVVVTNAAGCSTTSAVVNVAVNNVPLATVAAAGPLTFCEGKTVQLKAIAGAGYTYQWKRGGADIAGANASAFNASATGIYTAIVTNASGCVATSAGLTVIVKPMPLAAITPAGPTTFCSGKNLLLKANTGTNYTYQWVRGATVIPGAVQSNYTATLPGQYTVIVTNASGCSVTSAGVPVSVNPLPVALITPAGPLTFCSGQNVMLKANTGTNYTYQWKKAGVNIPDATQFNYTASVFGVYSVVVTNATGCPVVSAAVTVTVNNAPLATIAAGGTTSFCAGKSVLLKAITGTGYTYQWKKNGISIPRETTSSYTAIATGVYSVAVNNATGCSTTSTGISVAVTPAPLATVAIAGPTTFCEGKNVLLKAITGTGYTYQWKKNGINIPAQTQSNYTATATGVYTLAVTSVEGCSTMSAGINVTVTPAPAVIITANGPLTFPPGGNVMLSASAATGNIYQWKKDGLNIMGATSESYTATASGTYTVVITNAEGCQAISQSTAVSVTQERPITKNFIGDENFIKVYPNPLYRSNYINIEWGITAADKGILVTVSDATGRKINSQLLSPYDKTVRLAGASGVYIVEFKWGNNKRKTFTVIKID
jgi:ELWxxDGT repeat protein